MTHLDVRRLVMSSTLISPDPYDLPDFKAKFLVSLIKTLMRSAYEEIVNMTKIVRAPDLEWTIFRLTMLNDKVPTRKIRTGYLGRAKWEQEYLAQILPHFCSSKLKMINLCTMHPP